MTAALLAGIAAVPSAAQAADDCPNAAVRAQQQSQHLPNCMAYEKVTPDNKGGETPGTIQITEGGDGLTFMLNAGIEDAQSFVAARYRSLRSADGRWTTTATMPALDGPVLPALNASTGDPHAVTPDMSRMVLDTSYALDPNDQGVVNPTVKMGSRDVFIREADGSFRWLVPNPSEVDESAEDVFFAAASRDLERVVVGTTRAWDSRTAGSFETHLYVWAEHGTQLVTVLPDGELPSGLPGGSSQSGAIEGVQASNDARRVGFSDSSSGAQRFYVRFIADDPQASFTREVSIPPSGDTCNGSSDSKLSLDGKKLIFACYITNLPGGPRMRTYIRDLDGGPDAVRLVAEGYGKVVGATEDFSRVYLTGLNESNAVFLMRDGGAPQPVATPASGPAIRAAEISVDGEYLAFDSSNDFGLPGVDHSTLNGTQAYLYAARTDELTCISCRTDGRSTEGIGSLGVGEVGGGAGGGGAGKSGMRPVSTRGTVAFSSTTALVPEDTNGQADAYAWVDGRAVLLSGGRSPLTSVAQGGSADGSSLFFRTTDALVANDRDGGQYDLYVVRVNGGTLLPDPPTADCTSNCQGPPPERAGLPGLGSTDVLGRGNLVEETTSAKQASRVSASLTVPRSVRGTTTTVRVKVSRTGSIRVSGVGLRQTTVKAKKAGTYRVRVRLSANGVRQQKKRGRVSTRITARFTPVSGASVSARKSVTFTAKKGGR